MWSSLAFCASVEHFMVELTLVLLRLRFLGASTISLAASTSMGAASAPASAMHAVAVAEEASASSLSSEMSVVSLRHVFDDILAQCLEEIDRRCMAQFISSTHYAYVLSLKAKELTFLSIGHFKVVQLRECHILYAIEGELNHCAIAFPVICVRV